MYNLKKYLKIRCLCNKLNKHEFRVSFLDSRLEMFFGFRAMGPDFRSYSSPTTVKPSLLEEKSLEDLLLSTGQDFSFEEHCGSLYRDNTEYLLSIAQYGFVFLAKPCCMDKETTFSILQNMSKAALLERIIPNYVTPESLQDTAFSSSSAYVKSHVAAPFAVSLDFNSFNIKDIFSLHVEYCRLMGNYRQRKDSLNAELEELTKDLQQKQGQHGKFSDLNVDRDQALKDLELEFQAKRYQLNQQHNKEVKLLEQRLHIRLNALTVSYKSDFHNLSRELPVKLDELDRAFNQELKQLEAKLNLKKESLGQTVIPLSEIASRENTKQQRDALKQIHNQRCDGVRKEYSQRQLEVRSVYKQQQVDMRNDYVKQLEGVKLQHKQRLHELNELYTAQKEVLVSNLNQQRLRLSAGEQGYNAILLAQYEQDCVLVQNKLASLEAQHRKNMVSFNAVLTQKLRALKEQTIGLIKREYEFDADWQKFWNEEVKSFAVFLSRCLNLCFVGGVLKGVFAALCDTRAMINQLKQSHLVSETELILHSLERLIPILLSGGLNQIHGAIERIFSLLPAQSVVLHINEFDQLFVKTFANTSVCEQFMAAMKNVSDAISSVSSHIKFALMTGLTKFDKTSAALGLGQFVNLSKNVCFSFDQADEFEICFNMGA